MSGCSALRVHRWRVSASFEWEGGRGGEGGGFGYRSNGLGGACSLDGKLSPPPPSYVLRVGSTFSRAPSTERRG